MGSVAQAASVDPIILEQKGTWTAAYYSANNDGNGMCTLYTRWQSNGKPVAGFYTKYIAGGDIFIQLFKAGWAMPQGTLANVVLTFDNGRTYKAQAKARITSDSQRLLEFRIAPGDEATFLTVFADAYSAKLSFPDGNEPDWNADMRGSRETATAFKVCSAHLHKKNAPTQPTGPQASQPTQPSTQPAKPKGSFGDI